MQLDSFTILVAGCAILLVVGCSFIYFWYRDRRSPWLLAWGLPLVVGAGAIIFYMRPGWQSDFASIAVGNALRLSVAGILWQGVRMFDHRRTSFWIVGVGALVWIGLCCIPDFLSSMPLRVIGASFGTALFCGLAAWELWRGRAEALPSRLPAMLTFLSFTVIMLARIALVDVLPFPLGARTPNVIVLGAFMLIVFTHATFLGFLLIAMNNERREAEQRNFALRDPLTGLMNRRAFSDAAARETHRRRVGREAVALLVLDLDHFKSINDRFGHEVGDRMLEGFADIAERSVRQTDRLYRMGGEEFCFVLPDITPTGAIEVAERIRRGFEAFAFAIDSEVATATVSIGIATTDVAGIDLEVLLAAADAAVYEAKARGRNRIVVADPATLRSAAMSDAPPRRRLSA